jgi:glycosyltransferase involved in cell wall biosynthesis
VDFSIVIPAYNEEHYLPRTLQAARDAVAAVSPRCGEIIVVDNNSTDRTGDVARDAGAQVIFEKHNQISRARNRGAERAQGRALIFVDADTAITPQLLEHALDALANGACGGGATVATSDRAGRAVTASLRLWNSLSRRFGWAAGAFVFCLREAWQDTGGFSLQLYASEELDFSRRLRQWGRARNLDFRILPDAIDTSMRKAEWYSPWRLLFMVLPFALMPRLLRSRRWCGLWYKRPG